MDGVIQLLVLIILLALGVFFWRQWQKQSVKEAVMKQKHTPSVSEASIEQVGVGGMIQLPPHGEALDAKDMQITARHLYDEGGFQWVELEGDSAGGKVWLDVCRDDELETSVTLERLTLADIGLSEEDVAQLDASSKLSYGGRQFSFGEKGQASFRPNGDASKAQQVAYWDFEGDDDKHDLGIESWEGESRVYLTQRLDPARIRIYSLGETP